VELYNIGFRSDSVDFCFAATFIRDHNLAFSCPTVQWEADVSSNGFEALEKLLSLKLKLFYSSKCLKFDNLLSLEECYKNLNIDLWGCFSQEEYGKHLFRLSSEGGKIYFVLFLPLDCSLDKAFGIQTKMYSELLLIFPIIKRSEKTSSVNFWYNTSSGPDCKTRHLDMVEMEQIIGNYNTSTQDLLKKLYEFKPTGCNQIMLLYGPPGTGKTYALRGLFHKWKEWANLSYIVDPISFLAHDPSYFMKLLLSGVLKTEKHNIMVLEDAGALIKRDAANDGISRLLNSVDGLLGQGLRLTFIITTNEEINDINPAVIRPGRCLVNHEFGKLNEAEAKVWLKDHNVQTDKFKGKNVSLAELYAEVKDSGLGNVLGKTSSKERVIGFRPSDESEKESVLLKRIFGVPKEEYVS
jgi:hypothetical protein